MDDKSTQAGPDELPPVVARPQGEPGVILPGGGKPYGGFWRRVLAAVVDTLILIIPMFIIITALNPEPPTIQWDPNAGADPALFWQEVMRPLAPLASFALMALYILYFAGFESSSMMATPGKRLIGLRVSDLHGRQLSVGAAFFRAWPWWLGAAVGIIDGLIGQQLLAGFAVILVLIACIAVAFTPRKQGIHDLFAGCLVTKRLAIFGT